MNSDRDTGQGVASSAADPVSLDAFLDDRYRELENVDLRARAFPRPPANPPLAEDESRGFLRGLRQGLFSVEIVMTGLGGQEVGYCSNFCDVKQHLMSNGRRTGKRDLSRESIAQWAAASDLALDFAWPQGSVQVESSSGWDLDLIAYDRDRREADAIALLAGEAKARPGLLRRLMSDMTVCGGSRPKLHHDYPKPTEHNKCLGLLRLLSSRDRVYFWGVAPGLRESAIATRTDGGFVLEAVTIQPRREDVLNLIETA